VFDAICTAQVFAAAPWLAIVLAWYAALLVCSRVMAEVLFLVARVCGNLGGTGVAKWVGKASWELARMFSALGLGTPRRYLAVRYIKRDEP
jgi:hypothetical protein